MAYVLRLKVHLLNNLIYAACSSIRYGAAARRRVNVMIKVED
jgi:hypothetical protein